MRSVLASRWIELAWPASLDGGDWRLYARLRAASAEGLTAEQTAEDRRLARVDAGAPCADACSHSQRKTRDAISVHTPKTTRSAATSPRWADHGLPCQMPDSSETA